MAAGQGAAQAGPAVDLRDTEAMRSTLFYMLIDWDGSDLKNVYEPISQQIAYLFAFLLIFMLAGLAWRKTKRWNRERQERPISYRVVKPPSEVITERAEGAGGKKKRIVAVLGGTGFVGSHVVEELLSREDYHVYLLGRRIGSVSEELRSKAAALLQVDLMDYEGLVKAFQGVDSIIHAAASVPNVYSSVDSSWRINKVGMDNVLAAAQASGVSQLVFVSGVTPKELPSEPQMRAMINCFTLLNKAVLTASNDSLATCVLAFGQIYGINNYYTMFLKGQMTQFPLPEIRITAQPVEYVASVVLSAETKLVERSNKVVGKLFAVPGYPTTAREFFTLPEWDQPPPRDMSMRLLYLLARVNVLVARVTRWAPMGVELVPAIVSMIEMEEKKEDESLVKEALDIESAPDIRVGVKNLVEKFKKKKQVKT